MTVFSFNREELRKTELSDMFINNNHKPPVKKEKEVTDEVQADELKQKLLEQEEKHNKIIELREAASNAERYSREQIVQCFWIRENLQDQSIHKSKKQ